ncbi:hypothetical protein CPB83DRAFT_848404 [Crepidotus variabilis]|uniref:Uncharacterized protein n=1 Tax=Crepidotus variabilis TaxID=179855 RepID=A0A9P6ELZ3_9AGAR|nr:hypothetical protein CPB83DRAFT_848404 [Crepidotus variabilis]
MLATPGLEETTPSDGVLQLIERVNIADPNLSTLLDDDNNGNWGHRQFTAGNITWSGVLTSWDDLGNNNVACELIAATVRTCKVARHICFERKVATASYLADIYLDQIVDKLWELWQATGKPVAKMAKGKSTDQPINVNTTSGSTNQSTTSAVAGATDGSNDDRPSLAAVEKLLKALVKEDLKVFVDEHSISVTAAKKEATRLELTAAIIEDETCFTRAAFTSLEALLSEHKAKKVKKGGKKDN